MSISSCVAYLVLLDSVLAVAPRNNTVVISTYAKVAKWGAVNPQVLSEEGRSSGQTLFTQRSDAKVRTGQNINRDVMHHFLTSRVDPRKSDNLPAKGEAMIQDRFNPPPYFDFASESKQQSQSQDANPSIVQPPANSFQSNNFQPSLSAKPSYDVPETSYDLSDSKDVDAKASDPYDSPISSYNPIPSGIPSKTPYQSYSPLSNDKPNKPKFPGYVYDPPVMDSEGDKYMGPYAPADATKQSMMPPDDDNNQGPPIAQTAEPPSDDGYLDHPPGLKHHHKPDDDADLSPPPAGDSYPKHIPEYLDHDPSGHHHHHVPYSFEDHHHVYHQVKTTTTTEAPEDERVNKGHYSYYYLGRKLWYIPLYFSVYFIIYIAVLILKSIARHKVNFAHEWGDKGKGRSFGEENGVDENAAHVNDKIDGFRRRYIVM